MADGRDHPMHDPVADDHDASADAMARTWGPNGVEAAFLHEGDSYSLMLNESIGPLVDKSTGTALFGSKGDVDAFTNRRPDSVFGDMKFTPVTRDADPLDHRMSDFRYRGTAEDPPDIAEELKSQDMSISDRRKMMRGDLGRSLVRDRAQNNRGYHEAKFQNAATRFGVDADVLAAMAKHESSFNPLAVGPENPTGERAKGIMQIMPSNFELLGITDWEDATQNINAGAKYLAMMMKAFGGDLEMALTAYNWGPGRLRSQGMGRSPSRGYVESIMATVDSYR